MKKGFHLEPVSFEEIEARLLLRKLDREAFDLLSDQTLEQLHQASLDLDLYFANFFNGDIGYASRKARLLVRNDEVEYRQIGRKYKGHPYRSAPENWALSERCLPGEDYLTAIIRAIEQEAGRVVSRDAVTPVRSPDWMDMKLSTVWHSLWSLTTWHPLVTTPEVVGLTKEFEILPDHGVEIHLQRFPAVKSPKRSLPK